MIWTGVGTNTFSMNSVLLAGFAVCSRNSGTLNVSSFDNVSLPAWSPPPSAPLNLTATASNAAVFLQWNPAATATGYKLKRALVSGGGYNLIASQVATNYTDSAVTNGTFYYYVVTATNAAGDSAVSAEVFAQPESLVPPPLSVQALGNQLQFQWPLDHLGWRMQAQTNSSGTGLGANWTTVTGSSATNLIWLPLEPGNGSVFFRLIYP
jgi:cellulose 1,4-beta-cellobiosidase